MHLRLRRPFARQIGLRIASRPCLDRNGDMGRVTPPKRAGALGAHPWKPHFPLPHAAVLSTEPTGARLIIWNGVLVCKISVVNNPRRDKGQGWQSIVVRRAACGRWRDADRSHGSRRSHLPATSPEARSTPSGRVQRSSAVKSRLTQRRPRQACSSSSNRRRCAWPPPDSRQRLDGFSTKGVRCRKKNIRGPAIDAAAAPRGKRSGWPGRAGLRDRCAIAAKAC